MLRRLGIGLALLLTALVVGIPGWIALHRDDLPAVDDADLEAPPLEGKPEEDGWPAFREAADAVVWPEEEGSYERLAAMLRGEAWEPEWLRARLRENAAAFAALERALAVERLELPPQAPDEISQDDPVYPLIEVQDLARLAALRARLLARRGEGAAATESALLGMRVGRKVSESHRVNLLAMILANANQSIAVKAAGDLLLESSLHPVEAKALAVRLGALRWEPDAWRRAWATEYRFMRATLEEARDAYRESPGTLAIAGGADPLPLYRATRNLLQFLPADYVFQHNRTLDELAGIHRRLGQRGALDWRAAMEIPAGAAAPSPWKAVATLLLPNAGGRLVVDLSIPNLALFDAKRCHLETRISLVQALAGLTAYRHDHGDLPERLDALVPDYLAAVPEDRFAGEPLRWSRAHGVVWSLGEDLVDDGPPAEPSQGDASAPAIAVAPAPGA